MTFSIWTAFFSYAAITAITPGPNNILAMNAASSRGMRNSRGLLAGIYLGFFCVMLLSGLLGAAVSTSLPDLSARMKYIGAAYIFWLAWHIVSDKNGAPENAEKTASFLRGFLLQFVNVKIILYGITIFTGFVFPNTRSPAVVVSFILLSALIGNGATHLWALTGATFSSFFQTHRRASNTAMALLLIYSAVGLLSA